MNETIFSSQAFASAWCAHFGGAVYPLPLAGGPGPESAPTAVATVGRTGLRSVSFAPEGFYGSPGWDGELEPAIVGSLLKQLQARVVRKFVWNVRFDHASLAELLRAHLGEVAEHSTQVLHLAADYTETFSGYNATIRNQVRKAEKTGVRVRVADCEQDMRSYYAIHERHVARRGGFDFVYPQAFLAQLLQPACGGRLLLADVNGHPAAGGIFLPDGNSVYYFHSAYDPEYSKQFPTCAVIDRAIDWAHQIGARTFNLGGSAGIDSLERFKSFWGAEKRATWRFSWRNPLWSQLDHATKWIRKLTHSS